MSTDQFKQQEALIRRHKEALRFLAILVERVGGEVVILPSELMVDRRIAKTETPLGDVVLTVELA